MTPRAAVVLATTPAPGGAGHPDALKPQGPDAHLIAQVWWFLLLVALVVFGLVLALIAASVLRRRRAAAGEDDDGSGVVPGGQGRPLGLSEHRFITVGGVVVPAVILVVVGVVTVRTTTSLQAAPRSPVHVQLVGADWFWRVRYPDDGVVTANEIVVPAGRPVEVDLESEDVIHSFWVPQLTGKTDLIPGNHNTTHFTADDPGTYRGQCAEFCGLQHANMAFFVRALPPADFQAWLDARREPPAAPTDAKLAAGRQIFENQSCAGCHVVAGTPAQGLEGPDLTDVGSRRTLAAGTIANTPDAMRSWILDAPSIKPGARMPPVPLPPDQADDVVAYLESLKP